MTDQQGSTINLASGGSALIGLGILAIAKTTSPAIWFGIPSAMALITNQVLLHDFKMKNLEANLGRGHFKNHRYYVSLRVTPEGYFINKFIPLGDYSPQTYARIQVSVVKVNLTF